MEKPLLSFFVLAVVLSAGCIGGQQDSQPTQQQSTGQVDKTFVLTGVNFRFFQGSQENPELRVRQGERVRIEFTSTEGYHDWVVDEFDAATEKVWATNSTSVEFVADKKGSFEYYCSVGQHRAQGMWGNLIVE